MFCSKCGAQMADGAQFCGKCGAPAPTAGAGESKQSSGPAPAGNAAPKVEPFEYYKGVWQKYFVFEGRASRAEYWWFFLFNMLAIIALSMLENSVFGGRWTGMHRDTGPLSGLYQLAVCIPSIAVGVRRLHDSNHRGWWLLLPIVNLIMLLIDGDAGPNRFGPDPKGRPAASMPSA